MNEKYLIIPDTEGTYSVGNFGNIRNNTTGYVLSPFMTARGYLQVSIQFASRTSRITVSVHKLVARAFVANPDDKLYVNHIDGCKTNNAAANLEWVTPLENNLHAVKLGLIKSGEDAYLHKLLENEVKLILSELANGARNVDLARKYNVAPNTIDDIRCNRTWRNIERSPIASSGPIKKLIGEHIPVIRELIANGRDDKHIAKIFGVAPATINQIRHGRTWKNY